MSPPSHARRRTGCQTGRVSSALHRLCLAPRKMKERADHTDPRPAVETPVFVLLVGAWLWGVLALDTRSTAAQAPLERGPVVSDRIPAAPRRLLIEDLAGEDLAGARAGTRGSRRRDALHVGPHRYL